MTHRILGLCNPCQLRTKIHARLLEWRRRMDLLCLKREKVKRTPPRQLGRSP